jgi:hypothetical protein
MATLTSLNFISDININDSISTEMLSKDNLIQTDTILVNLNFLNEQFIIYF